jgi:tryptophan-rich sensory protein
MVPAWLIIGTVAFVVAWLLNRLSPKDIRWFNRLRRPNWLTFEWAIPWIWISIFICSPFAIVYLHLHGCYASWGFIQILAKNSFEFL